MNELYQTPKRKRIPYGMMNFVDVREDDCYFVDKTVFIPAIENANKFFFFIRPRRFGYYATTCEFHHTTDELIEVMKPWYDNYCFAEESYSRTTSVRKSPNSVLRYSLSSATVNHL